MGRSQEIAALTARLAETRLLTLTGIGGIGKSRLALEVGKAALGKVADEVWLVELAAIAEPGGVVGAVASVLGVHESGERPLLDGLVTSLSRREVLLILDNCEHLAEATSSIALELLRRCPALRVLATSRIPLDVDGEATWRVEPFAVPDPARLPARSALTRYAAVRLFVDRALAARSDFRLTEENAADVVRIAARLDGIPLAIELSAARVGVLSPRQIVQRLDDRFHLLTSESRSALPPKITINPAIAQGISHDVGSLEPGKLADIVLWRPEFFGVKPQFVVKSGFVAWGPVGSGNDSTRLGQPQIYRPMFGSYGAAPASLGVAFVSQASIDNGLAKRVQLRRKLSPVQNARPLTKASFRYNQASPKVHVDPSSLDVEIDGKPVDLPPAETLPLTQRYFI